MSSDPQQLAIIAKGEKLLPELTKTSKKLTELQVKLNAKVKEVQATKPVDKKKIVISKVEVAELKLAIASAKIHQAAINKNITDLTTYIVAHKNDLVELINKKEQEISSTQKKFKDSSTRTEHKIASLQDVASKIEKKEKKIITKKRQNVLSKLSLIHI